MKSIDFFSSSRPGRPPKRNSSHQLEDCLDDKRMKLSSSLLLRSFPDFADQSNEETKKAATSPKREIFAFLDFKYPVHSNGYLSIPTANGNQTSPFAHSFGYSAFAPTLPLHFPPNHHVAHHHQQQQQQQQQSSQQHSLPSYLLNDSRISNLKTSSIAASSSSSSSSSSQRSLSSSK